MNRDNTVELQGRARLVVSARNLIKVYGPTRANDDVSLAGVAGGDVIGLVGGNGAGKSTLMRMLCGVTPPDSGTIDFGDGIGIPAAYDATEAQKRGIRIVHQELSLCANLSVENFFLEAPQAAHARPGWRKAYRARAEEALDAVFPGHGIDVDAEAGRLPIGERQMVEIARAVATPGVRLVILDEPTSSLGLERSRQLRAYIHAKAATGLAFIFISHKLHEIVDVATRVVLMRNGRLEWEGLAAEASVAVLVKLMGGDTAVLREAAQQHRGALGDVCLTLRGGVADGAQRIELRTGQIVGLAGLEGSGQKELLHRSSPRLRAVQPTSSARARSASFRGTASAKAYSRCGACLPISRSALWLEARRSTRDKVRGTGRHEDVGTTAEAR